MRAARLLLAAAAAILSLALPAAAAAGDERKAKFVAPGLLAKAKQSPSEKVRVIVQSQAGADAAEKAVRGLGSVHKRLKIVDGVAVELPAGKVEALARVEGLSISEDAPVELADTQTTLVWQRTARLNDLWGTAWAPAPQAPTIAIVDSGVDTTRADFAGRVLAQVNLTARTPNSPGDGRGHGTLVAGLAAGSGAGYPGAAPNAKLVSLDVFDDYGIGATSDVIAACEWILANKDAYGIRVANFSLHSLAPASFLYDPLDHAVEKLWFAGIVVVAAAGNYSVNGAPSGVLFAPGNDPFVITVGASDPNGTTALGNDAMAPWSSYGATYDGFSKPEVSAPGRYLAGPVPTLSTMALERPDRVVAPGYMWMSGTSFSAPVVAGAAAQLLARRPSWTPDQVKGALMATARAIGRSQSGGLGQIDALAAAETNTPPNPNLALNAFVVPDPNGGSLPVFDAASWTSAAKANESWDAASWTSASWTSASWTSASWTSASWTSASWTSASWTSASWTSASWTALTWVA